jgi:hypothetical protein
VAPGLVHHIFKVPVRKFGMQQDLATAASELLFLGGLQLQVRFKIFGIFWEYGTKVDRSVVDLFGEPEAISSSCSR